MSATSAERADDDEPKIKRELDVEVNGKRFSVAMWVPESAGAPAAAGGGGAARRRSGGGASGGGSGSGDVTVPMQGTIVKINVAVGDEVEAGDAIVVLEAMKMENNVTAEKAGTVTEIRVSEGDSSGAATSSPSSSRRRLRRLRLLRCFRKRFGKGRVDQHRLMDVGHRQAIRHGHRQHRDQLGCMAPNDRPTENHARGRIRDDLHKPARIIVDQRLRMRRKRTLVTRTLRPSANASISAKPTSAISGSVKIADAALS